MPRFSRASGYYWADAPVLQPQIASPDRDYHSFARQHRVGEPFLTQFFDALEKLVVVVRVVMREGQALHVGHFRKLHGLIEAAVSPSAPFLQFLGRVLRVMDQQVRVARQLY